MFSSPEMAQDLTWHAQVRANNGMLSHPRDSPSWKLVNRTWKEFREEKRNLRLALSADGPKQPGNNIDVYLAPLIADLKLLLLCVSNMFREYLFTVVAKFEKSEEIYGHLTGFETSWGKKTTSKKKTSKKEKENIDERAKFWHNKSIFLELEYWKKLLFLHQLDVMHIKKNVCESVYETLLNFPAKTKDGLRARQDLEAMCINPELQTQPRGIHTWLPPACYTLNTTEKHRFYETLSTIKVSDRYCSNFKNLVSDDVSKMNGCHVLMQQLLPFEIKGVLHVKVMKIIIEKYFPPSFFDVMIHLMVHLVREVRFCGLFILECYVAEEALEFCSDYLKNMKSIGNPQERVDERIHTGNLYHGDHNPRASQNSKWLQTQPSRTFISWLKTKVDTHFANGEDICESVRWLAKGPSFAVKKYNGFAINEYRFHRTSRDESRTTQCSGVSLFAHAMRIASEKDSNLMYRAVTYYGRIQEIRDLDYLVNFARLDHQSERFILASQAKQVFYVQDQQDANFSVVDFTPHKMYKYGENGETDDMLEYHATFDFSQDSPLVELDDDFLCIRQDGEGILVVLGTMESDQSLSHDEDSKQRGPTIKGKTTKGKVIVTYNKKGVLIGVEATKLASFEGMVARSMVSITYATWRDVEQEKKEDLWQYILMNFELDPRSRKDTLQSIGTKWKNFKHYLYKKFIEKFKNDLNANMLNPPEMYLYLKIDEWKVFVSQRLSKKWEEISQKAKKMRGQHRYNHRLSRKGYVGLTLEIEEMQKSETLGEVSCGTNYMLTQALGASCQGWGKADFEDNPPEELLDTSYYLAIDIASNIVAKGTIVKHNDLSVMMKMSVQGDALLPFPLDEEFIYKVKDAVGFLVKWPRHLVIRCSDLSVKVQYEDDMFGYESFTYITWEDFEVVFTVDEMIGSVITCYMMAMKLYTAQTGSNKRVSLNWINVLCLRQSGGTECGYYVCKFMKEIVENGLQVLVNKNLDAILDF
ncbi:hypothetical protein F3Y22_tig00111758pilonHSYRG00273 [Hibiscus syriacus]|uniref:DUF4218 domain-containing protein n=1 Tax=Hibiscus syriacus TaxID=106335 RepID=A0A6A2XEY2_HIBSY|nr:hypothetical protein F3Y22_tig00111758pilonHSYRG00273 [Hibiscus syriacus]